MLLWLHSISVMISRNLQFVLLDPQTQDHLPPATCQFPTLTATDTFTGICCSGLDLCAQVICQPPSRMLPSSALSVLSGVAAAPRPKLTCISGCPQGSRGHTRVKISEGGTILKGTTSKMWGRREGSDHKK